MGVLCWATSARVFACNNVRILEGSCGGTLANLVIPPGNTPDLDTGYDMPTSSCTGNKKSVFIGINYFGQSGELRGCINDVTNIKEFVVNKWQFPTDADHMLVLTDEQDETLIPVDYKTNGVIVDDEIHRILVAPLPRGVRITAITDCCHSGSIFDLPYTYTIDGSLDVHEVDNRMVAIKAALSAGKALIDGDKMAAAKHSLSAVMAMVKKDGGSNGKPVVVRK